MPYTSDTAPEQLLQAPGAHPWKASWVHPGEPAFGERAQATQEGLMNQTVQALPSRQGDKAVEQANDIYQQSMQRLAKRQTNGTDLTAVQTRKATPETPRYTSAADIFKQYATKPVDGPEQQALDYAQTHRGLYAVTDFVASLANVISAAHGATPQQMTSLSAANGQYIQQLRQIQEARRQRYEQGLMSAALSDAQYNNQREERLRQEAREDAYRRQQQDNTDRAFRAQQEQQEENIKLRKAEQASQDKYRRDSLDVKSSIAAANAAIKQGAAETAKLKNDIVVWQKRGLNISTGAEPVYVDRQWYQNQKGNYAVIREKLQALVNQGNDDYKEWLDRIETARAVNYTDEKAKAQALGTIVDSFLKSGLPYAQEIIADGVRQYSDAYAKLTGGAADTIPWAENNGGVTEIPWAENNGGKKEINWL